MIVRVIPFLLITSGLPIDSVGPSLWDVPTSRSKFGYVPKGGSGHSNRCVVIT